MDFMDTLVTSKSGMRQIFVIVDKFSKFARLVAMPETAKTEYEVKLFKENWVRDFGLPKSIVSNRDVTFTSELWKAAAAEQGTQLQMTYGNHPEANGQAEQMNRAVQHLLRHYIKPNQVDWDEKLALVASLYNNAVHNATGVSPNSLQLTFKPRLPLDFLLPDNQPSATPGTLEFAYRYEQKMQEAVEHMQKAQAAMIETQNRHRRPSTFQVGDRVWVKSSELGQEFGISRKLMPQYFGPWEVLDIVGTDPDGPSYVIRIPGHLRTYPVFHASKLAAFKETKQFPSRRSMLPPTMDGEVDIDDIVDHREMPVLKPPGRGRPPKPKLQFRASSLGAVGSTVAQIQSQSTGLMASQPLLMTPEEVAIQRAVDREAHLQQALGEIKAEKERMTRRRARMQRRQADVSELEEMDPAEMEDDVRTIRSVLLSVVEMQEHQMEILLDIQQSLAVLVGRMQASPSPFGPGAWPGAHPPPFVPLVTGVSPYTAPASVQTVSPGMLLSGGLSAGPSLQVPVQPVYFQPPLQIAVTTQPAISQTVQPQGTQPLQPVQPLASQGPQPSGMQGPGQTQWVPKTAIAAPKPFTGDKRGEDLDTWLRAVPVYVKCKLTLPHEEVLVAASYLEGSAARWLSGLVQLQGYGHDFRAWAVTQKMDDFLKLVEERWHDPQEAQKATDAILTLHTRQFKSVREATDAVERLIYFSGALITEFRLADDVTQSMVEGYREAQFMSEIIRILEVKDKVTSAEFELVNGLLFLEKEGNKRLCVPDRESLRSLFLGECHDATGHFGFKKTAANLLQRFWWPTMMRDAKLYVETCQVCQRDKPHTQAPLGLLKPLPIPERPGESLSMDFMDTLVTSKSGMRHIFVIVDRFSKYARLIAMPETAKTEYVIRLFKENWVRDFGVPKSIVSDRDVRFTSELWKAAAAEQGTQLQMTFGNHPEANGQAEQLNRAVHHLLRHYIKPNQVDWGEKLALIASLYNNAVHSATGGSPNSLLLTFKPRLPLDFLLPENQPTAALGTLEFAYRYEQKMQQAIEQMQKAQAAMIESENRHHRQSTFQVGDRVWVKSSELGQEHEISRKLMPQYFGPWEVLDIVETDLDGPSSVIRIPGHLHTYPVFHASKLSPFEETDQLPSRRSMLPPTIDGEVDIDDIVDHKEMPVPRPTGRGRPPKPKLQYRVRFRHHTDPTEDRWFTKEELMQTAPQLLLNMKSLCRTESARLSKTELLRGLSKLWRRECEAKAPMNPFLGLLCSTSATLSEGRLDEGLRAPISVTTQLWKIQAVAQHRLVEEHPGPGHLFACMEGRPWAGYRIWAKHRPRTVGHK
ncbi:hypothetical protein CBR_g12992 [Chara braunii]|uniref:Integrase catalytic domain-containing protein n=1 Tax=Chara braunii TaxID=69332 RepID=A0A388KTL4_CHABU|nr:hypothetical protein CBR_g12992 [Chara braunii]|eukprot:GBG73273.1 hypothetical protein CBR_g12992 [Chara braunii]